MTDERDVALAGTVFKKNQCPHVAAFIESLYTKEKEGNICIFMGFDLGLFAQFNLGGYEREKDGHIVPVTPLEQMITLARHIDRAPAKALKILDEICDESLQIDQLIESGQAEEITSDDDL